VAYFVIELEFPQWNLFGQISLTTGGLFSAYSENRMLSGVSDGRFVVCSEKYAVD